MFYIIYREEGQIAHAEGVGQQGVADDAQGDGDLHQRGHVGRGHDPIRADGAPFFFWGTLVALLVGLPLAYGRIKKVRDVFARGVEVEGHILEVKFFRDRGSVACAYTLDGRQLTGWNAIMRNSRTAALEPGHPVTLVVDSTDHKKAHVRDLYV